MSAPIDWNHTKNNQGARALSRATQLVSLLQLAAVSRRVHYA